MFKNRKEAGKKLAVALQAYKNRRENPLILAIPRGGVEVGYYIARKLECDFSVVVSRKLGHPRQPEAAFGAMAEDKSLYLNPLSRSILTKEIIEHVMVREEKEIRRRAELYRKGEPLPKIKGRTIILVDDGIATGSTLLAAIRLCKKQKAGRIIVAAPVSGRNIYIKLLDLVDEVMILETPPAFYAVTQAYQDFRNLTDEDVIYFMDQAALISRKKQVSPVT